MAADDSIGLAEAWAEHLARQKAKHPNAVLKDMFDRGAPVADLLSEMNKLFAVVILNINNRYAGTKNATYFAALKLEIDNGGAAAMLHDLLAIDLSGFNVRDVPRTAAKAQQQTLYALFW